MVFYHSYVTHIKPDQERRARERELRGYSTTGEKIEDALGAAIMLGLGAASIPIWAPALAVKGAAILANHGAGLTAAAMVTIIKSLAKGHAPKDVVKELIANAGISIAIEGPLENWI